MSDQVDVKDSEQAPLSITREEAARQLGVEQSELEGLSDQEVQQLLEDNPGTAEDLPEDASQPEGDEPTQEAASEPVITEPVVQAQTPVTEPVEPVEAVVEASPSEVINNNPNIKYPNALPERLRSVYESMTLTYRLAANTVCQYIDKMGPESFVNETTGAAQQKLLFSAVANLLNAPEQEFRKNIQFLFPIFTDHIKGVFSETNIHRFAQFIDLSSQDAKAMPFLFELMRMIADPRSRTTLVKANIGHMPRNLERASSGRGLNEQGRVNLLHYLEL